MTTIKDKGGQIGVITMEASRLSRQQLLVTEEVDFHSCAIAVGLAERPQGYKTSRYRKITVLLIVKNLISKLCNYSFYPPAISSVLLYVLM